MPTNLDIVNCALKSHHPDRRRAQSVIDRWPKSYRGCHAYLCPVCREGWLVGHVRTNAGKTFNEKRGTYVHAV